ncbi:MAG: Spy/CpxP family protein refolding chaperone [Rhizobiales bacterium]|nr:Spy/CpxP family protein refolding chaperone [Hyphomicrobiales bacterium]
MSEQTTNSAPTPPAANGAPKRRCRGRGRAAFFVIAVALAGGITGAVVTKAFSQDAGFGPGWRHGMMMNGPVDPAKAAERADRMVRHLGIEVDATPEQQEKLRAIVKDAVRDLAPLRDKVLEARMRARDLLTQATIDRAAIETLRADQIALADGASKRLVQAITDAAEVLTAEQRRKINDRIPPRGRFAGPPHGHWWR